MLEAEGEAVVEPWRLKSESWKVGAGVRAELKYELESKFESCGLRIANSQALQLEMEAQLVIFCGASNPGADFATRHPSKQLLGSRQQLQLQPQSAPSSTPRLHLFSLNFRDSNLNSNNNNNFVREERLSR